MLDVTSVDIFPIVISFKCDIFPLFSKQSFKHVWKEKKTLKIK